MTWQLRPLADVPAELLLTVLNDERIARHMPLWGTFTPDSVAEWVRTKTHHSAGEGLGPQAVWMDGRLAGWAGIQPEDYGPDLAVVLAPWAWGIGAAVADELMLRAAAAGLAEVFIALPSTRRADHVVTQRGFSRVFDDVDGFVVYRKALQVA